MAKKIDFGPSGILGREFDIVAVADGTFYPGDSATNDFVLVHFEFELAMDGARGQEDVDPCIGRALERFPGAIDVGVVAACQAANGRAANVLSDLPNGLEIAGEAIGKPASIMSTPKSTRA